MKRVFAFAVACAAFAVPLEARAAESDFPKKHESKQWFELELRFAPYWPAIDSQPGLTGKPYYDIFGGMARLLVSAELDVQIVRIPHFGSIGPAFSFGYTQMSAPAPLANGMGVSAENTNIEVYPFYLVAVLRVDALMRDLRIPIVPYLKLGPAFTLWRVFNDSGTETFTQTPPARRRRDSAGPGASNWPSVPSSTSIGSTAAPWGPSTKPRASTTRTFSGSGCS